LQPWRGYSDVQYIRAIIVFILRGTKEMKVNWLKDADAALSEAQTNKKPLLVDFSAAPA
jgi:hypothetical protein